jgi:superfamily II DNA helicase RecQ
LTPPFSLQELLGMSSEDEQKLILDATEPHVYPKDDPETPPSASVMTSADTRAVLPPRTRVEPPKPLESRTAHYDKPGDNPVAHPLYRALEDWRYDKADEQEIIGGFDTILSRECLELIAETKPQNLHELKLIPGVGPHKAHSYGKEILAIIAKH